MKYLFFLVLIVVINAIESEDSIQNGKFIKASQHFYVSTTARSFIGAWLDCKTGGMELASVQSVEEQIELKNATDAAHYQSSDGYWIGGVAEAQGSNTWYWIDSALRIIYTNWGPYSPRYYGNDYRRQCIRMGSFYKINEPYKWENVDCALELYYVCRNKN